LGFKANGLEPERLLHVAEMATARWRGEFHTRQMQNEMGVLSGHLASAYEELSLLYGLTQKI